MDNKENNPVLLSDDYLSLSPYFAEEVKIEGEERDPMLDIFPDFLTLNHSENQILGDIDLDFGPGLSHTPLLEGLELDSGPGLLPETKIENQVKKKGRPMKKKQSTPAKPTRKCVPSAKLTIMKSKKRKCMTSGEKAQHNQMERERRKGMAVFLERLRERVPAVRDTKNASQKKIIEETTSYLEKEKPGFLSYLKEKQRFLRLETRRRQLERELSSGSNGILCIWESRKGMSTCDLYETVKKEAMEGIQDGEIDEAIRVLESSLRSPESNLGYPESLADSEEDLEVEV